MTLQRLGLQNFHFNYHKIPLIPSMLPFLPCGNVYRQYMRSLKTVLSLPTEKTASPEASEI